MYRLQTRKIFRLALPAFFTQASFTVTAMLDLIMVGTISPTAIAAVGVGGTLYWNLLVLGHGPALSAGYLCAQSYGGGKTEDFLDRAVIGFLFSAVAG